MFRCFTTTRGIFLLAAAIAIGGYLVIWHGAHVAAALPILVLLACPFMHFFMHGGHGHHHVHSGDANKPSASPPPSVNKGE
jgi:hypothetical protein